MGKQTRDAHAGRLNVGDQDVEDGMVGHLPAGSEDTPIGPSAPETLMFR